MFNQAIKNIYSFFNPGKKSVVTAVDQATGGDAEDDKNKSNIRILYHRDSSSIQTMETKPELMQHDWWIN